MPLPADMDADELADLAPDHCRPTWWPEVPGLTEEEAARSCWRPWAIRKTAWARSWTSGNGRVKGRTLEDAAPAPPAGLPDHTDQIFVVDRQDKLQGILPLSRLLVSEPTKCVPS